MHSIQDRGCECPDCTPLSTRRGVAEFPRPSPARSAAAAADGARGGWGLGLGVLRPPHDHRRPRRAYREEATIPTVWNSATIRTNPSPPLAPAITSRRYPG